MHEYAERIRKMPGTMYAADCDKNPDLDVDDLLSSDPQEVRTAATSAVTGSDKL